MIGTTISHYKILEKLGEGGMGVVYKAQDTKLDRFVALKFLPERVADSEQDRARFMHEAKAASALNHPNVCTIYGIEEHEGQMYLVMEFVEGQTLTEKKASLSLKQSIEIGIQLSDGLAAAHEKGIVHRDIKPDNIMIRKDGIAQIMDFGLAKLRGVSRLTKEGSTVGTAGYMSPEQVQGQDVDHRSDIFSLGVVLYELFSGQLPFKGVHETALLYEIVNVDPRPMVTVKPETDPALDAIIMECLEKDPNERSQAARQIAVDLKRFKRESGRSRMSRTFSAQNILPADRTPPVDRSGASAKSATPRMKLPWIVAAVCLGLAGWMLLEQIRAVKPESEQLNISVIQTSGQEIFSSDIPCLAISPDGKHLAYTLLESGKSQIYVRPMNAFQGKALAGTQNGTAPFFSPDGQWIGFSADGKIKKVPASGGSAVVLADAPGFRGASWGPDDRIYFSPTFASGVISMTASGGDVRPFSILDSVSNERTHRWPQVLPDGQWVLYTVGDQSRPNSYVDAKLVLQSVKTGERYEIGATGEMANYIEPGYLVIARDGALLATPFDLGNIEDVQSPVPVINDVAGDPGSGVYHFSVSRNGRLVFLLGSATKNRELVWVTRDGRTETAPLPAQPYWTPRISPDGNQLTVTIGYAAGGDNDVWIYDLRTSAFNRLTFEKKMFAAIWGADGKSIYYTSGVNGGGIMAHPADGSSSGTLLSPGGELPQYPTSLVPGRDQLIVQSEGGSTDGDISVLDFNEKRELRPLLNSQSYEFGGHVSPDGKYVVYCSNEAGAFDVYVRTYPDLKGRWQVSTDGAALGTIWSPDGREILYVNSVGRMMSVTIRYSPSFSAEAPRELFDASGMHFPNIPINNFDITPDGKRFLMVRTQRTGSGVTSFNLVTHWTDALKLQLSTKR